MSYRTYRELIASLLTGCGEIDDKIKVKVVKRDKNDVVVKVAVVPISYLDAYDNICIEFSELKWEDYK